MLASFLGILGAIGILLVLIVVHEAGHFFAARYFGMQTPVVGLGLPFLGPTWKVGNYKDVEFRFHPFLLGAYVAIPEMDDESAGDEEMEVKLTRPKQHFPAWQRMIVSFAGPGANLIFAFILCLLIATFIGIPDKKSVFIMSVTPNASAEVKEKIKAGDRIIAVDKALVNTTEEFKNKLEAKPNQDALLWIQRDLAPKKVKQERLACLEQVVKTDLQGHLKVALDLRATELSPIKGTPVVEHFKWAWNYFYGWFTGILATLWYLISAPFKHLVVGPKMRDVHGIIFATGQVAEFLKQDASSALQWGALFSIELAIFNLLPILPLDGGHILFQGGEIVTRGRKLPQIKQFVAQTGLVLILALTCLIIFNDLRDLIFPAKL